MQILVNMADIFYGETGIGVTFTASPTFDDPLKRELWASTADGFHWTKRIDYSEPFPSPNEILTDFKNDYDEWKLDGSDTQDSN
jgi:hypothetical protein